MAKDEKTGKQASSAASKLLRNNSTPKPVKTVAASDLTQAPDRGSKRKKR